ncbi:hypothetical protein Tco_0242626 [Tanacetum coccineum]
MSSITAQQTKLDLELVPKENRLDIRKCNGRIPLYMHQFWNSMYKHDTFYRFKIDKKKRFKLSFEVFRDIFQICPRVPGRDFNPIHSEEDTGLSGKTSGLDKLRLSRAQILWESTQIYGAILPECLTSSAMKESKAYKTYLDYAIDEEHVTKSKRVKRPAKKSTTKPAAGVVIREAPVETKSKSKEKEKVDVTRGKGIKLLSEVALTEEAQMKEVRKKSLRDFQKTHPSGTGTVAEKPLSVDKITPTVTSKRTGDKPGVHDVTEDDSTESESDQQENESKRQVSDSEQEEESKDDDQEEEEFVHTPSPTDDKDDDNMESESADVNKSYKESDDKNKSDEESDDVIKGDKEIVRGEGDDAKMIDAQQENENLETTQEQVVKDAHVTISTVTKKTEVPVTSSSRSFDLASKFLNFSDIPHTDAIIVSPLDVHVHHEVPRTQPPTLLTIPVSVITESSPVYTNIPQSS